MSDLVHDTSGDSTGAVPSWWKHPVVVALKRNPVTVTLYNAWLDFLCRDVECYIFVATTGRSGTTSLSRVFETVLDGAICLHEPPPVMFSDYPRGQGIDRDDYFRRLFWVLKRTYIKRDAAGHRYYLETNHQFIKNFAVPAIEYFGPKTRIIHLKRDPVSVAASFLAINSVPAKTQRGHYYMLDPDESTNIIRIPELSDDSSEFGHDLYKCLWYWYETEARVQAMKERYPNVVWVDVTTDQLNDRAALQAMFDRLGIPVSADRLDRAVSIRENLRTEEKKEIVDLARCEEMDRKLRGKIEAVYGKKFPDQN
ncbi:MAG: hypothetical protein WCH04_14105 [Gammaproteobacteria bacterium]